MAIRIERVHERLAIEQDNWRSDGTHESQVVYISIESVEELLKKTRDFVWYMNNIANKK